jgi:predicted PurR-regulated permease PerM
MTDDRTPAMAYWARATMTIAGVLVLLAAAWKVREILLLVLVATVLAVGLDPQVRWLQRKRVSRGWAVTIILVLSGGLLVLFAWLVIPQAVRQTQELARNTPDYIDRLRHSTGFLGTIVTKYNLADRLRETMAKFPGLALGKLPTITASAGQSDRRNALILIMAVRLHQRFGYRVQQSVNAQASQTLIDHWAGRPPCVLRDKPFPWLHVGF